MKNLTILRQRKGYTRKQMAEFLHVTVQTYSRYEEGYREPSILTIRKISKILEAPISLLLDEPEIDPVFEITVDTRRLGRPIVHIVKSEPHLTRDNRVILEKYFALLLNNIDIDGDIEKQIQQLSLRNRINITKKH